MDHGELLRRTAGLAEAFLAGSTSVPSGARSTSRPCARRSADRSRRPARTRWRSWRAWPAASIAA